MHTIHLDDRSIVIVSGPDAEQFLQNLITTDLAGLGNHEARPGALLSPQGKILFDFLVSRAGEDAFRLDCPAAASADLVRRLTLYKLRARVEIAEQEQSLVAASWEAESDASQSDSTTSQNDSATLRDTRFASAPVLRHYGRAPEQTASRADWNALRIRNGVAESGDDFALGDAFPHDVLFDRNGGVGLRKGCYVGQEVVSRMQHRGTARRRLLVVSAEAELPPAGTDILVDGRPVGRLGTVEGNEALAIARIDKVGAALELGQPVTAGGVVVTLSIREWAGFSFPAPEAGSA